MQSKILTATLSVAIIIMAGVIIYLLGTNKESQTTATTNSSLTNTSVLVDTVTEKNCLADDCLLVDNLEYPAANLPSYVITALGKAIDDEYKARATYEAVIDQFGSTRPFSMIIRAEEQHISSLKAIYDKYGVDIPVDPYEVDALDIPDTIAEACQLGVEAEIANAALYRDELLPEVSAYADIISVFESLMNASQEKHLPAFQKCS